MRRIARPIGAVLLALLFLPSTVYAQQAAITGVVRDASGGVLPGVTVEATSPVLIEKTRTVVTDTTGQYRIVDLLPGEYTVTFSLTGFSAVKRDGIQLSGAFVATVNADLQVGSLEETITVSGETPVVDVQSARTQQTVSKEVLAAIPTGRTIGAILNLMPGVFGSEPDVGGSKGVTVNSTWGGAIHGGKTVEGRMMTDSFPTTYDNAGGGEYLAQTGTSSEIVVSTSGGLGEADSGGVTTNVIPRDGGNTFTGSIFFTGANSAMQGSNYTQALKDAGLTTEPNSVKSLHDFNPAGGGRIIRDKLWFYMTYREINSDQTISGMYFNKNANKPNVWTYEPDLDRRAFYDNKWRTGTGRVTWQATPRNKINTFFDQQWACWECKGGGSAITSPEASGAAYNNPSHVWQVTWSSPISSRLLMEAGTSTYELRWRTGHPLPDKETGPEMIRVVEQGGAIPGLAYRAPASSGYNTVGQHIWRASISYVTGAHQAKFGYYGGYTAPTTETWWYQEINQYRFNNGTPNQFTMQGANPLTQRRTIVPNSFYAQDVWTMNKLTLQGGVRYDHVTTEFGEFRTDKPKRPGSDPRRFINPPIVYPEDSIKGVNYHDISPRLGASYDLRGNGKTALKTHLGRYPMSQTGGNVTGGSLNLSPPNRLVLNTTRNWTDSDRDFVPDCDLTNRAANLECGAMANQNFGVNKFGQEFDTKITEGWFTRPYQWEGGVSVQQEVFPRVAVNVGYYYRWYGNFSVVDNLSVTRDDFDEFFITAPVDPRLGEASGQTIGPLYDIKPALFGVINNFVTASSNFGKQIERWKGVDVTVNARLRNGLTTQFGTATGRTIRDTCELRAALPETTPTDPYCRWEPPYLTSAKGYAAYTIPRIDLQLSGSWQSRPYSGQGNQGGESQNLYVLANRNVPNAEVRAILGRPLSGGAANIPVSYVGHGVKIPDRTNQVDVRIAKLLRYGRARLQIGLDIFNLTNTTVPTNYNQTYVVNGSWLTPTEILSARLAKISFQADF